MTFPACRIRLLGGLLQPRYTGCYELHAAASADMRKIFKRAPTLKNKDEAENRTLDDQLVDEHKKVSGEDF